jgi:PDZ domain
MVGKWFPAAVAAVFIGPALAAAQAPGVPTVEPVGGAPIPSVQSPQAPMSGAPVPVSVQPVAAPLDPVPAPQAAPPVPTGRELTLMGMVIVPDRSDRPVIQSVLAGSPAALAGIREDDLIEGIGRQSTPTVHDFLNFAIPLIRDLDPGTKLTWHVNRDGRDVAVSILRPGDRELGPLSDIEQRVIDRQTGSLGYYSSDVLAPPRPVRARPEPRRVGHDVYADTQFSWFYEGDDMPGFVKHWLRQTLRDQQGELRDINFNWWYDGDDDVPPQLTLWMKQMSAAQAGATNPDVQYYWWYDE